MNNEFELEKRRLDYTETEIGKLSKAEEVKFSGLPKEHKDDAFMLQTMMKKSYNRMKNLENASKKPYFARIDFVDDEKKINQICYIGKVGFTDTSGNFMITDWRTPIASIYYNNNVGGVSYKAPGGNYSGELTLKRQIVIQDGILLNIFDADSVSDDELLRPYLGSSADNRLKSIIASIQSEQNNIIRLPIEKNIITQGVAGSGKTTVALHRVAYLAYNHQGNYKTDQFMVIGPNKLFVNYISEILPDLDVNNVNQLTFEELLYDYIDEPVTVKSSSINLANVINSIDDKDDVLRLKSSMDFKMMIDRFITNYQENIIPKGEIYFKGVTILDSEDILKEYDARANSSSLKVRLDATVKSLINKIKNNIDNLEEQYVEEFRKIPDDKKEIDIWDFKITLRKELTKGFEGSIKKHLNVSKLSILSIYKEFIQNIDKFAKLENVDMLQTLKKDTLKDLSKKLISFEDIASIIYIASFIKGNKNYSKYVHTVLDEAQDYGEFHFFVLKHILSSSTFSIFGDLSQGIYSYRGLTKWEPIIDTIFGGNCELLKLEKSYRTTVEIMNEANKIIKRLGYVQAIPVIRHGAEVEYVLGVTKEQYNGLEGKISQICKTEYKSIAIICKTINECNEIFNLLKESGLNVKLIKDEDTKYDGGICILPTYLSKGLEFDLVILTNVNNRVYREDNQLDLKLLYVGMTRALHELIIFSNGEDNILEILLQS